MHNAATVTMLVSAAGEVEAVSGALTRLLGQDPEAVQGRPLAELVHPVDRPLLAAALARAHVRIAAPGDPRAAGTVEVRLRHRGDDRTTPFELTIVNLLDDPTVGGFVISGHDITRLRSVQDQLTERSPIATRSPDSPTAPRSTRTSPAALAGSHRDDDQLSVAFVDLDRFKPINDLLGHARGRRVAVQPGGPAAGCGAQTGLRRPVRRRRVRRGHPWLRAATTPISPSDWRRWSPSRSSSPPGRRRSSPASEWQSPVQAIPPRHLLSEADAEMYTVKRTRRASPREPKMVRGERRVLAEQLAVALVDGTARRALPAHRRAGRIDGGRLRGTRPLEPSRARAAAAGGVPQRGRRRRTRERDRQLRPADRLRPSRRPRRRRDSSSGHCRCRSTCRSVNWPATASSTSSNPSCRNTTSRPSDCASRSPNVASSNDPTTGRPHR